MNTPEHSSTQPHRWLPQIGLNTLLLLTACAAVWCGVLMASREVTRLQLRLNQTRELSRALVVKDRALLAAIKQHDQYPDEHIWNVFVPREGMKVHLDTTEITKGVRPKLPSEASCSVAPGQHTVLLRQEHLGDAWLIVVTIDHDELIRIRKEKSWYLHGGFQYSGVSGTQTEFAEGEPALLLELIFLPTNMGTIAAPGDGIRLWIE